MKRTLTLTMAISLLLCLHAAASAQAKDKDKITLVMYPDPLFTELQAVAGAMARGIDRDVEIKTGPAYADGRQMVIDGKCEGMLITRRMNKIRLEKANARKGAVRKPKLKEFTPLARKLIRSKDRVLDEVALGIASARVTPALKELGEFARSKEAAGALRNLPHMTPLE